MREINCPICGQNNREIIFKKGNLNKELINVICRNCALVYINPQPAKEEYDEFHKQEFLAQKSITGIEQLKPKLKGRDLEIKKTIVNFLGDCLKDGQNILDIGCGFGGLLNLLKNRKNINAFGIELSDLDVKAAKEYYGFDIFHGSLEEFSAKKENRGKFDLAVMHHVFEHLPGPLESLAQIKNILRPGGFLYIAVPSVTNIKKRPDIFFQIAHPFSYSPYSLWLMLKKAGFSVIKFNRGAGFPGGLELVAMTGVYGLKLKEGKRYKKVISYVDMIDKKFFLLRKIRESVIGWMPREKRLKFSEKLNNFLKKM